MDMAIIGVYYLFVNLLFALVFLITFGIILMLVTGHSLQTKYGSYKLVVFIIIALLLVFGGGVTIFLL